MKSFVFVIPALSTMYAERFLQYMQAQKIDRIAVAYDTKGADAVSGHSAMDEEFETATTDFSAILAHLRGAQAGAFVFCRTGRSGVILAKQYAMAGMTTPLFLTGSQASKLWLDPMGAAGEGVIVEVRLESSASVLGYPGGACEPQAVAAAKTSSRRICAVAAAHVRVRSPVSLEPHATRSRGMVGYDAENP